MGENEREGSTFAIKITFRVEEPEWFEPELVLHDGVLGWARDPDGLVVVTQSSDATRPLRIPEGLTELIARAGGRAVLTDRQPEAFTRL